jgi:hypothetical protein
VAVFQLTHATHDGSSDYHFDAPPGATEAEFKSLCDRLMREAAGDVLKGKTHQGYMIEQGRSPLESWIGYDTLVDEVRVLLEAHGYRRVRLPTVEYTNGLIIREPADDTDCILGPELVAGVVAANARVEATSRGWRAFDN